MELKAKDVSLWIKIFDVFFVVGMAVLKWTNVFNNCTIPEVCMIGGIIAGVFGDVSLNTAFDKFTKRNLNE